MVAHPCGGFAQQHAGIIKNTTSILLRLRTQLKPINLHKKRIIHFHKHVFLQTQMLKFVLKHKLSVLKMWLWFFYRLTPSRWMKRTRPTPWCPWLLCPRSLSTSQRSTESLHLRTGQTPPPPLTDTRQTKPKWQTQRCKSSQLAHQLL